MMIPTDRNLIIKKKNTFLFIPFSTLYASLASFVTPDPLLIWNTPENCTLFSMKYFLTFLFVSYPSLVAK